MTSNSSYSPAASNVANSYCVTDSSLYDEDEKMIAAAAAGLRPSYYRMLNNVLPRENAMTIAKYIASMKTEVNLSDHYRRDLIAVLYKLSVYISSKRNKAELFRLMTRKDIIAFLDSFRKPDSSDLCTSGLEHITHTECICSGSSSGYIIQTSSQGRGPGQKL
ncbi:MAG: hypothetical protein ACJ71J_17370 [Nitrososphaeraceae archaeon]